MSTVKKISKQDAEQLLTNTYRLKYVSFKYPGYPEIVGRCDRICIGEEGTRDAGMVLIFINDRRYSVSPESLKDCLKIFKPED